MSNQQKLVQAFCDALGVSSQTVNDELQYNTIREWDSTGHMVLVSELETVFNVMLDTDDIIDMSSVAKAKTILAKYGVSL
ncbi:acyl carrier protein [Alteromonas aestuariivivens]|uniref:Acyl carrier protein n=1 Tax=Alteromonas aestuariivivens TaxID=1938339 RepID=A0A3D8M6K6_9ALTE|nr:acyl carrier protein [Alteromonas aestuariivivens]RDV25261.1 acyl carrier protein [Alteromonas aestuariivivens]